MLEKKQKTWFFSTLLMGIGVLVAILVVMVYVDPYFHYHKPLKGISYRLYSERYMNHGIAKNFEYDAIITGSSMNQNFKATLMDELFEVNSIKIPFSGAGFQEVKNHLDAALSTHDDVKYVLWGLDYNGLHREHYHKGYDEYPDYLYDKNVFNDVSYVWNKNIIFEGLVIDLLRTLQREPSTTFDEYSTWDVGSGWEHISQTYHRSEEIVPMMEVDEESFAWIVEENIQINIVDLANKYPDTQFLLFYTPYSALYWESIYRDGTFERQLECERIATELMLECDNIRLFNFCQETEITGDVNNYRDKEHYVAEINDMIMQWIAEGRGLVTKDNYMDIINWEREYYTNYDYDSLYAGYEQYMNPKE